MLRTAGSPRGPHATLRPSHTPVRLPAISRSFSLSTVRKVSSSSSYVSMESVEPEPLRLPLLDPLLLDEGDGHVLLDAYRPLMSS